VKEIFALAIYKQSLGEAAQQLLHELSSIAF
jgi:hypothetical protein